MILLVVVLIVLVLVPEASGVVGSVSHITGSPPGPRAHDPAPAATARGPPPVPPAPIRPVDDTSDPPHDSNPNGDPHLQSQLRLTASAGLHPNGNA